MSQEIHRAKSIGRLLYNSLGVEIALTESIWDIAITSIWQIDSFIDEPY